MKSIIYETRGRAREFSELALNLFNHCEHGCVYCYAPDILRKNKEEFHKAAGPRLTPGQIQRSAAEYQKMGDTRRVLLCFTCDPYTPVEAESMLTRSTIEILHHYGLGVIILTKAGMNSTRDFDMLIPGKDAYAATLTCDNNEDSLKWEPGAALPFERAAALKIAHERGIETWVSFEPVIYSGQTFIMLEATKDFVGHYKVGTMNYHPQGKMTNWKAYGWEMKRRMDKFGVKYYFKKDLLREMQVAPEYFKQTWVCK